MAKRGYKLQEFVAHSANVNCLKIGKKTRRNFITGGDDEKVNLWSIGKPTATTSLSGHTSPIESVAFDSTEVLVAAGASSGVIKLWDLEETKVVRTLNGHRSYCTSLEFHPFGEFFASGSMDTNLKIWDIRKKGCIHTYKGHRRAVSTIRFSPDGRWVVSGGLDNVVKIWDLTAGKLLHEFNNHEGHIRSMDFHPLEFLLATGSSDKTVKFWDLETFELIGSTRPEATGVRSVTFHPDGRTLFCGLDGSLKVYSWEPVICHDALDMGWSTLGDLCIDDGKLLGCSYYQNSVAVWVADTSLIEPHVHSILPEENKRVQSKPNPRRSTTPPDDDAKDIKNIYIDSMTPVVSRKSGSVPTVVNPEIPKEVDNMATNKQVPAAKFTASNGSVTNELETIVVSVKPSHRRRPSTTKLDIEGISKTVESGLKTGSDTATVTSFQKRLVPDAAGSANEKASISTHVTKEPGDKSDESNKELKPVKYVNGVAVVHGRTRSLVERFEKREKLNTDETQISDQATQVSTNTDVPTTTRVNKLSNTVPCAMPEAKPSEMPVKTPTPDVAASEEPEAKTAKISVTRVNKSFNTVPCATPEAKTSEMPVKTPSPNVVASEGPEAKTAKISVTRVNKSFNTVPCAIPEAKTSEMPVKTPSPYVVASEEPDVKTPKMSLTTIDLDNVMPVVVTTEAIKFTMPEKAPDVVSNLEAETKSSPLVTNPDVCPNMKSEEARSSPARPRTAPSMLPPEKGKLSPVPRSVTSRRVMQERGRPSPMLVTRRSGASPRVMPERTSKTSPVVAAPRHVTPTRMMPQKAKSSPLLDDGPQTTGRVLVSRKDDVLDDLLQNHDAFVSSLRSRLTKLQVIRHFWEQSDTRGAITALRKLPDHAVQADVVNVLMEKMESLTLDLFPSLLPVLLDLLDSKTERHINVSLELLLKLVAVFGPVISSTVSGPSPVGVDLHAEKRLECCNECHIQLQKVHKCLPDIIRRGGSAARCAQELDFILQK